MQSSTDNSVLESVKQPTLNNQENVDRNLVKTAFKSSERDRPIQRRPLSTINSLRRSSGHTGHNGGSIRTLAHNSSGVNRVTSRTGLALKSPLSCKKSATPRSLARSSGFQGSHHSSRTGLHTDTGSSGSRFSQITPLAAPRDFYEICKLQPEYIVVSTSRQVNNTIYVDSDFDYVARLLTLEAEAALKEADDQLALLYQSNTIEEESEIAF